MSMTTRQKVEQAVLNNAVWCDTVCASHGSPGEFLDGIWINRRASPPYYPNAITLKEDANQENIRELMHAGLAPGWGIKDSFASLQLDSLGFQILFEAQWIYKPATVAAREMSIPGVSWEAVTTSAALNEWEQAWSGEADVQNIFLPALLKHPDVAIIGARREGRIVAGFIANCAADCIGVSNLFLPGEDTQELRNDCVAIAQVTFPDLPLVGYESGSDLETMLTSGFEAIGDLRVWLHTREIVTD